MLVLATPFLLFPVKPEQPTTAQIILFLMIAAGAILMLVGISIIKGPSPRFRWGKKPTDNPDEDL